MPRTRLRAAAVVAALTTAVAPALLTTTSAHAATADGGFSTVADLTYRATSIASTADGSAAYAAGIVGGKAVVTLVGADGSRTVVPVNAAGTRAQVSPLPQESRGAYLLVTGSSKPTLWQIVGTTATKMALPTTSVTGKPFTPATVGGNDTRRGVFLGGATTDAAGAPLTTIFYFGAIAQETTNTWHEHTMPGHGTPIPVSSIHKGSFSTALQGSGLDWQKPGVIERLSMQVNANGSSGMSYGDVEIGQAPGQTVADLVEVPSRDGMSARPWGAQSTSGTPERGWCGDFGVYTCEAPAFAISAATQLSDGRVLVGGRNTAPDGTTPATTAAPAGFALTDVNEVHPATVPGTVGNIAVDLSAATTGLKAWALTFDGTTTHVQDADLALFKAPAKPVPPVGVVPAGAAFRPFASVSGYTPQDVVMPDSTTGYVAGATADGHVTVQRISTDGVLHDVAFPGLPTGPAGTKADLVSADGHTGLLVTGPSGSTLWELAGDTAYPGYLPATMNGATFSPVALAADSASSVWVTGTLKADGATNATTDAVHWNGSTWEAAGNPDDLASVYDSPAEFAYAASGELLQPFYAGPRYISGGAVRRHPGTAAVTLPTFSVTSGAGENFRKAWTLKSADDYTMWGYGRGYYAGTTPGGSCTRVVNNTAIAPSDTLVNSCMAPTFPVSAATRLGDGRVVVGGTTIPGATATGPATPGFALVQGDGSTPVAIPGTVGTTTVRLAAAPAGGVVVALTQDANGYSLQYADLGNGSTPAARAFNAVAEQAAPDAATSSAGFLPNSAAQAR